MKKINSIIANVFDVIDCLQSFPDGILCMATHFRRTSISFPATSLFPLSSIIYPLFFYILAALLILSYTSGKAVEQ